MREEEEEGEDVGGEEDDMQFPPTSMTWMGRDEGRARENSPDDITRRRERERFFSARTVSQSYPAVYGPIVPYTQT